MQAQQLNDAGGKLLQARGASNKGIQAHLMHLIIHVHHHGADVANVFLQQCEQHKESIKDTDVKMWKEWLLFHGQLDWSTVDKKFLTDRKSETLKDESAKNLWWKWKKPKVDQEYNYLETIRKIQKAAQGQLVKRESLIAEGESQAASQIDVDADMMHAINLILGKVIDPLTVIAMVEKKAA